MRGIILCLVLFSGFLFAGCGQDIINPEQSADKPEQNTVKPKQGAEVAEAENSIQNILNRDPKFLSDDVKEVDGNLISVPTSQAIEIPVEYKFIKAWSSLNEKGTHIYSQGWNGRKISSHQKFKKKGPL